MSPPHFTFAFVGVGHLGREFLLLKLCRYEHPQSVSWCRLGLIVPPGQKPRNGVSNLQGICSTECPGQRLVVQQSDCGNLHTRKQCVQTGFSYTAVQLTLGTVRLETKTEIFFLSMSEIILFVSNKTLTVQLLDMTLKSLLLRRFLLLLYFCCLQLLCCRNPVICFNSFPQSGFC